MTDMRRTLLWVVFMMSLFAIWDRWNVHNGMPGFFQPPQPKSAASAPAANGAALPAPVAGALPAVASAGIAAAASAAPAAKPSERVTVSSDLLKLTFDSRGGDLVQAELLHYSDPTSPTHHVLLFDRSAQRNYVAQTGLITSQAGIALPNHFTAMTVLPGERTLKDGVNELQIAFESDDVGGVRLTKTFTVHRGDYAIAVKHEIRNASATPVSPQLYLQLVRDGEVDSGSGFMGPTSYTGPAIYTEASKFHKVEFSAIEKGKAEHDKGADNGWIAMVQHYFASAWLLSGNAQREFRTEKVANNLYGVAMVTPLGEIAAGATKTVDATLFVGPQEEKKLEALAPGLELLKDYGWLKILASPLFWLLDKLHGLIGNWGWAIVSLVILLKIGFYGLNASAYKSMAKMRAINPKVMEMRERYKDKPQQMQTEMMRIYREEKVNPFGGCLPILVQMPFFISLYWVLLSTVEMRDAPWIGWITDLSTKDPFYILPLLMTGSTMVQTALGAKPPDPVQAKMMWIMPLAFSVMFFVFPSGLVLYWLTNNLLSIAQQWFINRQYGTPK